MKSGSILVTGASGFVGRHLVSALNQCGEQVLRHSGSDGDLSRSEIAAAGVRHVYHLAGLSYVPESWKEPRRFYEVNVIGTLAVLEFCRKMSASLTLLSSYVYGNPEFLPIPETHPVRAFNPYSHSKLLAEEVAAFYQSSFGVQVAVVRAFNLYGPGQAKEFLIPTLIAQALRAGQDAITIDNARPRRDYIYISDLIDLLTRLRDPSRTGVYNAGSGVSAGVEEVAAMIIAITGNRKGLVSRGIERQNEVMETVADISRAQKELNWRPTVSLQEGLRLTVESMRLQAEQASC